MRIVTACALVLSLVACGGADGADGISSSSLSAIGTHQTVDFCQKGDACNAFHNVSVEECTATIDHALNSVLPAEAHDVRIMMDRCVQLASCKNFVACAQSIGR